MALAPINRMRESWFWLVLPLVVGFITPSLVIFVLEVWVGDRTTSHAFTDIMHRQFAEGGDLFLLSVWSLIPFVVLSSILLLLPATFSRRRIACLSFFGLLGALGLMVPGHWSVWEPLYSGGHRAIAAAVMVFVPLPFMCLFTMLVGFGAGWLVSKLPWFQPAQPGASGA